MGLGYNKMISYEDFSNPALKEFIREIYFANPGESTIHPPEKNKKHWEVAMSLRAMKDFGKLNRDSRVLGVGAGAEQTSFYLTNFVKSVHATDLYFQSGVWTAEAPLLMLITPERYAQCEFEAERLIVQHMDGRLIEFPDEMFDAIYSSSSIEHFGSLDYIANACYEMGRVLKTGGILTLSTEYKINGPEDGIGWDQSIILLTLDLLKKYIIEASGLEPVDPLTLDVTEKTMGTKLELAKFVTELSQEERKALNKKPQILLTHEGYDFSSVHLTLTKTKDYPSFDNSWAAPDQQTIKAVQERKQQSIHEYEKHVKDVISPDETREESFEDKTKGIPDESLLLSFNELHKAIDEWERIRTLPDAKASKVGIVKRSRVLFFILKTIYRLRYLGRIWKAQSRIYKQIHSYFDKLVENN